MLLKHSFIYLLGRGGPAIVNLLAVAVYTRMLRPEEYGRYALVFSGAMLANMVFFQWLRLSLLRFLPSFLDRKGILLSTLALSFLALLCLTGFVGGLTLFFLPAPEYKILIGLGILFFWLYGWFEINLELARSQLAPLRYGLLYFTKATVALGIGVLFIYRGFGAAGILAGLICGTLIPVLYVLKKEWKIIRLNLFDKTLFTELFKYGMPLTGTFALSYIIGSSDRFLLGWFLGAESVGLYSVSYDLAKQSLFVLMMVINLAAFPIVVRALEQKGFAQAQEQLENNIIVLLAVSLPASAGFAFLAPNIAGVLLGQSYQESAATLIPLITLGMFLAGLVSFYFSQSFHLSKSTLSLLNIYFWTAFVNVGMNLFLIPAFGPKRAAYSAIVAYTLELALCYILGRRVFYLPFPLREGFKIVASTCLMCLALWPVRYFTGPAALTGQICLGVSIYALFLMFFDIKGYRRKIFIHLHYFAARK